MILEIQGITLKVKFNLDDYTLDSLSDDTKEKILDLVSEKIVLHMSMGLSVEDLEHCIEDMEDAFTEFNKSARIEMSLHVDPHLEEH